MKKKLSWLKLKANIKLLATLLAFMFMYEGFTQDVMFYDYHEDGGMDIPKSPGDVLFSEYGGIHTPKGPLKVLLVFAQFEGDQIYNGNWQKGQLPDYDDVLYTDIDQFNPNNTDLSISNYYYQMSKYSGNPFKLYGEMFPEVIKIPTPTTDFRFSTFTTQVFDTIETKYPDFHWNTFDQRTNYPTYKFSNVTSASDGKFDYVVICFRWNGGGDPWGSGNTLQTHYEQSFGGSSPSGWASITSQTLNTNLGTYKVSGGFTSAKGLMDPAGFREFFFHEFGHTLYNAPHYNGANSVCGNHFYSNAGWGMMGSGARHKYCTLGWEQWWLGWNDINYDLNNSSQNNTYTLFDFISTGEMMRLKIPNTNQYLWIEFHNGESVFEERGSLITNKQGYIFPQNANGVLAYVECISDNKSNPSIFGMGADGIKYIHGGGNYEYDHSETDEYDPAWWPKLWDFYPGEENPFAMQNGVSAVRSDFDNDDIIRHTAEANNPGAAGGNEMAGIVKSNSIMTYDAYGKDMNLKVGQCYSIGSNPAIIEHQTYSVSTQELSPIRLHGLRVRIIEQTSTYAKVEVLYDYNKVEDNIRWAGNIELPVNQEITLDGAFVTLDRSGVPSREFSDPEFGFLPYSNFSLKDGSILNIRNNSTLFVDEKTEMVLESGCELNLSSGTLEVTNGSTLIIRNGAKINVNKSGKLIINSDASIVIEGEINTLSFGKVELNGSILIKGTVNINGSGFISLNNNLDADPGANLTIMGTSKESKLLEVEKSVQFNGNFANISIKNGKIQMNNTSAELYMNSHIDNITIDNVKVTSNTGVNNGHEGIDIRSNGNIVIKNSTFENGTYGIYAYRSSYSSLLNVDNCSFTGNTYGLRVYNGGFDVNRCNFTTHSANSIYASSIDKSCYISHTNIANTYHSYGVYFEGSSSAGLSIDYSTISNNRYGLYLNGQFTSSVICSSIQNNTYAGITVYNNGSIYLTYAPSIDGGHNFLNNNKYALYGSGGSNLNSFFLNNGYNDLTDNGSQGSYTVGGQFSALCGTVVANNNKWKSSGPPIYGVDYNVLGGCIRDSYLTITDNSPESYISTECFAPKGLEKSSKDFSPYDETFYYREITTSIGIMPLNEAVIQILNTEDSIGIVYDLQTRYDFLCEVLASNLDNLNMGEEWYVKHSYKMLKVALGQFKKEETSDQISQKVIQKMIKTIKKLEKDLEKSNNKGHGSEFSSEKFAFIINKADVEWYGGAYDEAINILEKAKNKANDDQLCELIKMICRINLDRDFIESDNTLDIDEALEACEICNTEETDKGNSSGKAATSISNKRLDKVELNIVPNPVKNGSVIRISGAQVGSELYVYNSIGSLVFKETIASENYSKTVSNTELTEGIYLVSIMNKGMAVANTKMVVVK
jgi:hypothetical protein